MDLFKIRGVLGLDGVDKAKDDLTATANEGKKTSNVFEKIGTAITKTFKINKVNEFGVSLERLNTRVSTQQNKLDLLKQKYADLYLTQGRNSKEAKACADEIKKLSKELNDNEKKLNKAKEAADKYDKSLDKSGSSADKNTPKFSKLNSVMGKIGGVALKAGTAAVSASATAISFLTKSAVENYAEYEQLVGGVETLFGTGGKSLEEYAKSAGKTVNEVSAEYDKLMTSQQTVLTNAANAYKTAGLSANEYMDTVTSFSASLLQSLGGDTQAAAEMADLAITDMADNANKMGTDMTAIQNAYQGFAKQNYTMLDNLKLGYGGTKEEMQRLIDDANALNAAQGNLTNYSIDSYADIVSAIHDVQTQMGITGTTAKEASTTIEGSVNSAKAAWQNWLTALGDSNADIQGKTDELVSAIETAAGNVLPVVEQVLSSIGQALATKLPELLSQAVSFVIANLPQILMLGLQLIEALIDGLGQGYGQLMSMMDAWAQEAIVTPVRNKVEEFKTAIHEGFETAKSNVLATFDSIKSGITGKIDAAREKVHEAIEKIKSFFQFSWELPPLKLPHISISGKFSLNPPSVPNFGIEWYKKGGILTDPTMFGFNPMSGKAMVGGEAGAEAIAPIDTLKQYVAEAVSGQNQRLASILEKIANKLDRIEFTVNTTIDLDGATVARKTYKYYVKEADYRGTQLIKV